MAHNETKPTDQLDKQTADDFLKVAFDFKLGNLPTETPNPKSVNLSYDAKENVLKACESIRQIDLDIPPTILKNEEKLAELMSDINNTLKAGNNIYLCGCGATGRLSLALETIWRVIYKNNPTLKDRVVSFMAGGDVALINSVEKFEDFPEYGARQLMDLGFKEGDLLISTTEGGETPFVIGATEKASIESSNKPYILYCNPDEILVNTVKRSRDMIENPLLKKVNLTVGPMALTGSTRMQATTVLMYYVGLGLFYRELSTKEAIKEMSESFNFYRELDLGFLEKLIVKEADVYQKNELILYETNALLGISILTDTTERSPTFSLHPFENLNDEIKNPSLSYLYFPHMTDGKKAWEDLLQRSPRAFYWPEVTDKTSVERLYGFDFSKNLIANRAKYLSKNQHHFKIYYNETTQDLSFEFLDEKKVISLKGRHFLSVHMILKMLLNNLSTVIMGRIGRYESNLMTWVRSSNNKLIDRSVRYAQTLLKQKGIDADYEELVRLCFDLKDNISRDEPLVMLMVERMKK